jgi:hypothetical protein
LCTVPFEGKWKWEVMQAGMGIKRRTGIGNFTHKGRRAA